MKKAIALSRISALFISLLAALAIANAEANDEKAVMGYAEFDCWVDNGPKCIIFDDGSAYIFDLANRKPGVWRFKASGSDLNRLLTVYSSARFISIPSKLWSAVMDGNELNFFFADAKTYHEVKQYCTPNEALQKLSAEWRAFIIKRKPSASQVEFKDFLSAANNYVLQHQGSKKARLVRNYTSDLARTIASRADSEDIGFRALKEYMVDGRYLQEPDKD